MINIKIKCIINILVCTSVSILIGCNSDEFKDCSFKLKAILLEGMNKLVVEREKNKIVDGEIYSTKIIFNNKKTIEYLAKKNSILMKCFSKIDKIYQEDGNTDALFVLALTNELVHFLSGKFIEDRSKYLDVIQKKEKHKLSLWVMDEIFGPILRTDEELIKEWVSLDYNIKYMEIYNFLTNPIQNKKS